MANAALSPIAAGLSMAAMGKFFLPDRATAPKHMLLLLDIFEKELKEFPGGKHDDTVDAATLFARILDRIIEGRPAKPRNSPHGDTMDDLWSRHDEEKDQRRR